MDACGSMFDAQKSANMDIEELIDIGEKTQQGELLYDPIHYSPIHSTATNILQGDLSTYTGALDQQLCDIYPVCARLKTTYSLRIEGASQLGKSEVERVIRNMNNEMSTLLSTDIDGVPSVYHMLYKESQTMIEAMTAAQEGTKEAKLMKRMFFKRRPSDSLYTTFGYRMNGISSGCKNCLLLMQKQISLFLILYARHFAVTSNRVGVSGFYIVAGPPDTGKSRACELWLSCIAKALQLQSDGGSAKSYTADDKSRDLRCSFEDELKDLLTDGTDATSGANIKAKQSLLSNGIITYERLQQTNEVSGDFELKKIVKAERKMTVTCTNALKNVPEAIQSRASVVPLTGTSSYNIRTHACSANTLVAIRDNKTASILSKAFMMQLQLFSCLQGRFWQLEAFGAIGNIDTTCVTIFQLMLEKNHGKDVMKPRR